MARRTIRSSSTRVSTSGSAVIGSNLNNIISVGAQSAADVQYKGWYQDEAALLAAFPNGIGVPADRNGWSAIVGTTDTYWVWDADTNTWVNSGIIPPTPQSPVESGNINQVAHGLIFLDAVYFDGTDWLLGNARDNEKLSTHVVVSVVDVDNVVVQQVGRIDAPAHGLNVGSYYIEDPRNPGQLTDGPQLVIGDFYNPIYHVPNTDQLVKLSERPNEVEVDVLRPALTPDNLAFVAEKLGGNIDVIDVTTDLVVATIATGFGEVRCTEYHSGVKKLYVADYSGNTVRIYDLTAISNTPPILNDVVVSPKPIWLEIRPGNEEIFVAHDGAFQPVIVIDYLSDSIKRTMPFPTVNSQYEMKFSNNGEFLYLAGNGFNKITADEGTLLQLMSIGAASSPGVQISHNGEYLYYLFNSSFSVPAWAKANIGISDGVWPLGRQVSRVTYGAGTFGGVGGPGGTVLLDNGLVYTASLNNDLVSKIDPSLNNAGKVINRSPLLNILAITDAMDIDVSDDQSKLYVAHNTVAQITIISTATDLVTGTIATSGGSSSVRIR